MSRNDKTSYQRHQRHREQMLEMSKQMTGVKVEVHFTPTASGGRSLGRHIEVGTILGVAASPTLKVNNVLVLLRVTPDEKGRTLTLVNIRQINHIVRLVVSPLDVESLLAEVIGTQAG